MQREISEQPRSSLVATNRSQKGPNQGLALNSSKKQNNKEKPKSKQISSGSKDRKSLRSLKSSSKKVSKKKKRSSKKLEKKQGNHKKVTKRLSKLSKKLKQKLESQRNNKGKHGKEFDQSLASKISEAKNSILKLDNFIRLKSSPDIGGSAARRVQTEGNEHSEGNKYIEKYFKIQKSFDQKIYNFGQSQKNLDNTKQNNGYYSSRTYLDSSKKRFSRKKRKSGNSKEEFEEKLQKARASANNLHRVKEGGDGGGGIGHLRRQKQQRSQSQYGSPMGDKEYVKINRFFGGKMNRELMKESIETQLGAFKQKIFDTNKSGKEKGKKSKKSQNEGVSKPGHVRSSSRVYHEGKKVGHKRRMTSLITGGVKGGGETSKPVFENEQIMSNLEDFIALKRAQGEQEDTIESHQPKKFIQKRISDSPIIKQFGEAQNKNIQDMRQIFDRLGQGKKTHRKKMSSPNFRTLYLMNQSQEKGDKTLVLGVGKGPNFESFGSGSQISRQKNNQKIGQANERDGQGNSIVVIDQMKKGFRDAGYGHKKGSDHWFLERGGFPLKGEIEDTGNFGSKNGSGQLTKSVGSRINNPGSSIKRKLKEKPKLPQSHRGPLAASKKKQSYSNPKHTHSKSKNFSKYLQKNYMEDFGKKIDFSIFKSLNLSGGKKQSKNDFIETLETEHPRSYPSKQPMILKMSDFKKPKHQRYLSMKGLPGADIALRSKFSKYPDEATTLKNRQIAPSHHFKSFEQKSKIISKFNANTSESRHSQTFHKPLIKAKTPHIKTTSKMRNRINPSKISDQKSGPVFSYAVNTFKNFENLIDEDRVAIYFNRLFGQKKVKGKQKQYRKCVLDYAFFGLYEGVGGNFCANFFKEHLHRRLLVNPKISSDVEGAVRSAIHNVQKEYFKVCEQVGVSRETATSASIFFSLGKESLESDKI